MGAKTTRPVTGAEEMGLGNVAEETFCHRTVPIFATWLPSLVYIPLHNRLRLRRHQIPQRIATKKIRQDPIGAAFCFPREPARLVIPSKSRYICNDFGRAEDRFRPAQAGRRRKVRTPKGAMPRNPALGRDTCGG